MMNRIRRGGLFGNALAFLVGFTLVIYVERHLWVQQLSEQIQKETKVTLKARQHEKENQSNQNIANKIQDIMENEEKINKVTLPGKKIFVKDKLLIEAENLVKELYSDDPDTTPVMDNLNGSTAKIPLIDAEPKKLLVDNVPALQLDKKHKTIRDKDEINVKRMVLATYMRGGSTYLGEMINQNPDAFIWFEPLDGVFSQLYGTNYGWHSPDIMFDGSMNLREIPDYETKALVSAMHNILHCNIDKLPTQMTTHNFFKVIHTILKMKPYSKCITSSNKCASGLSICPSRNFKNYTDKLNILECHDLLSDINSTLTRDTIFNIYAKKLKLNASLESDDRKKFDQNLEEYKKCYGEHETKAVECRHLIEEPCRNSSIRAFKTVRLRMQTIKAYLDKDFEAVAVLLFRDPRGIVASRFQIGYVSTMSERSQIREAQMICDRMMEDYKVYIQMLLESKYDGRVLMLKYEKMAEDPEATTNAVYTKLLRQNEAPKEVLSWLHGSIAGAKDNGGMGTIRKNSTETANKWHEKLKPDILQKITTICEPILTKLRYPL